MVIDGRGKVVGSRDPRWRDSAATQRMTYTDVDAVLSDPASPQRREVPRSWCRSSNGSGRRWRPLLTKRRRARGAIDMDVPVATFQRDDEGRVAAIVADQRTTAQPDHRGVHADRQRDGGEHTWNARECQRCTGCTSSPTRRRWNDSIRSRDSLGHSLGAPPDQVTPAHFQKLLDRVCTAS